MHHKLIKIDKEWNHVEWFPDTRIHVSATIGENVRITGSASIGARCAVLDEAEVGGTTVICADSGKPGPIVAGKATIVGASCISGQAKIFGNCRIAASRISGRARVFGRASITHSSVTDKAIVQDTATILDSFIGDDAIVKDNAYVRVSKVGDKAVLFGEAVAVETTIKTSLCGPAPVMHGVNRWITRMVAANKVQIGCQIFTIRQWLDDSYNRIPWYQFHVTPEEKLRVRAAIKFMAETAQETKPWPTAAAAAAERAKCTRQALDVEPQTIQKSNEPRKNTD